jgi:hypothetical protein
MKTRLLTIKKHPDTRTRLICGVDKALSGGLIRIRGLCEVAPKCNPVDGWFSKIKEPVQTLHQQFSKFMELVLTRNHGFLF